MKTPCEDIFQQPHQVLQNYPQMPLRNETAQYVPFTTLTGSKVAIGDAARQTTESLEMASQEAEDLNLRLSDLMGNLKNPPGNEHQKLCP